jgi:hypothetical protein
MRFLFGALLGFVAGAMVAATSRAVGVALADAHARITADAGDAG